MRRVSRVRSGWRSRRADGAARADRRALVHQHRCPASATARCRASSRCRRSIRPRSWSSTTVPEHLLVLGGGYVGLEFGQMFRRFGSQVTVVQRGPRLLAREDADVAEAVADLLREDGIEVLLQTDAAALSNRRRRRRWWSRRRRRAGARRVARAGRRGARAEHRCARPGRGRDRRRQARASCRRTSGSRRMCPASTPWAT